MLTKVEVRNRQGALLSLPLDDISNGLILGDIDGLDPVKATLVSSSFAGADGSQYLASRREDRNIKLTIELQPDFTSFTVRDLRNNLYNYFMTKSEVNLRFYDSDSLVVEIWGRVETCETALFSPEPAMDISIMCFEPDFLAMVAVTLNGMSTADITETLIPYTGTVETGIQFVFNIDRPLTEFTFYHRAPDGTIRQMDIAGSFIAGDILTITTVQGSKSATLTRSGSTSSLLYAVSPQSNWIELMQGDNYIRVYATGAAIPYSIVYTTRYGGL
jgi:hypothetical protein